MTNPPIDAIREEVVTDTTVYLGNDGNLLEERADNAHALQVGNPILTSVDLMKIRGMKQPGFQVETVSSYTTRTPPSEAGAGHLFAAVDRALPQRG